MSSVEDDPTAEVTDLLQHLIRNACVNDGNVASGSESRSVDVLRNYLGDTGLDMQTYEPQPGRQSLITRIEGRVPGAPTLTLLGHTDVVPVNEDHWTRDPFGGELIDGEIWGRGAIDMLNLTSSMAVAVRRLAQRGWTPDGTLIFAAVADEEAAGNWGARHLADHELDAVRSDYVLTESGGFPMNSPGGTKLPVMVGEKGCFWCQITVSGTAGHGSQPFKSDNALVKAAEVVKRIAAFRPETNIGHVWRRYIEGMELGEELSAPLLDPDQLDDRLDELPVGMGRLFHACTHTTMSPNMAHGGTKVNTIPDSVTLEVDVRMLPGQTRQDIERLLFEAVGDLRDDVVIDPSVCDPATESPIDTPLWDTLNRAVGRVYSDGQIVPMLMVGGTDARFFRRLGATAYGFGLFSRKMKAEAYGRMFHGDDERVDVESLRLSTEMWEAVAVDLLGGAACGERPMTVEIKAALFDFGGVILSSPFEAFAHYEASHGLPEGFLRQLNATNPDTNAWARLERNEVELDEFCALFEDEAHALGGEVEAMEVLSLLSGELRPEMVAAVQRCSERLKTGLLTNNIVTMGHDARTGMSGPHREVLDMFDVIVESSRVGVRKPDPAFYERACTLLDIAPTEAVFLDDLGINLKPARAMGMTTIKVGDPADAIAELEAVVGFALD